jgi:PEP-CTERM motif
MFRIGLKRGLWASALLLGVLLPAAPAQALVFQDDFNTNLLHPDGWVVGSDGGSSIVATGGRVELTQGAGGFAALSFVLPVVGDFTATVNYTLLEWPANNQERLVLNAYAGPNAQLSMQRISDSQYDTTRIGEVYVTDFTGQGILGTPTTDRSGTLRLTRTGDAVQGAFREGAGWTTIGTYTAVGEGSVQRSIGMGIFPGLTVTPGVKVALDDFALVAPLVPIPEPQTYVLLLAGLAALGLRLRKETGR